MADTLAIISKAQFEQIKKDARVGDRLGIDRYVSTNKALQGLAEGGSLFLVTVRPPDEQLWLVGILEGPKHADGAWKAAPSPVAIADISGLKKKLKFQSGKGIEAKPGALGMSLQTPRGLTAEDVRLLREAAALPAQATPPPQRSAAPVAEPPADKPRGKVKPTPDAPTKSSGHLATARAALEQADRVAALNALLEAWRERRATELADLIDVVSADLTRGLPAIEGSDPHGAWMRAGREAGPADVGRLVAAVLQGSMSTLVGRVELLAKFSPDPRLAMAAAKMALEPPVTSTGNYPAWAPIYAMLRDGNDARTVPLLNKRLGQPKGDSQFWPKLYAQLERILEKIGPAASLSSAEAKEVAALDAMARKLASGPAQVVRAQAAPAKPKDQLELRGSPLEQALQAIEAGRPEQAIDPLLAAWRSQRLPAIGDLIDKVSALVNEGRAPPSGSDKDLQAAWTELAAKRTAADIGLLAEASRDGKMGDVEGRLEEMLAWPEDPRIADFMLSTALGRTFADRERAWHHTMDLLARNADARILPSLREQLSDIRSENKAYQRHCRRVVPVLIKSLEAPVEARPGERSLLERISASLTRYADGQVTERKLVDAILEKPEDDGPRLVYADWLMQRGNPRGELVILQCEAAHGELSAQKAKRLQELQKLHPRALLGPAAHLIYQNLGYELSTGRARLERGFITALEVRQEVPARLWAGHPALSFVESVESNWRCAAVVVELAHTSRRLTKLTEASTELVTKACDAPEPLSIRELHWWHAREADLPLAGFSSSFTGKGLSNLTTLEFGWSESMQYRDEIPDYVLSSPMMRRVEELRVMGSRLSLVLAGIVAHKLPVRRLLLMRRFYLRYQVVVDLDEKARPVRVVVGPIPAGQPGAPDADELKVDSEDVAALIELLEDLPVAQVKSLTVEPTLRFEAAPKKRLAAILEARFKSVAEVQGPG